jgi:hypothetical protein
MCSSDLLAGRVSGKHVVVDSINHGNLMAMKKIVEGPQS